ncbi:MAG TPA: hypothetical protein VIE66_04285 [Methylocella sp.]
MVDEDYAPFAAMMDSDIAVPRWIRAGLARLLYPKIDAPLASKDSDRLIFRRSDAVKGKMKTQEDRIAAGLAVIELMDAGKSHDEAVAEVTERLGKEDPSYVKHAITLARRLPEFYKRGARKL